MNYTWEKKTADKGLYRGYRIEKEWHELNGRLKYYTVQYMAYDENGDMVECCEKLKDLKHSLDSKINVWVIRTRHKHHIHSL